MMQLVSVFEWTSLVVLVIVAQVRGGWTLVLTQQTPKVKKESSLSVSEISNKLAHDKLWFCFPKKFFERLVSIFFSFRFAQHFQKKRTRVQNEGEVDNMWG